MNHNDPSIHLYNGLRHIAMTFQDLGQNAAIPEMVRDTYRNAAAQASTFLTGYEMVVQTHLLQGKGPRMTALRDYAQWLGIGLTEEKIKAMSVKLSFASEELLERYDTSSAVDRISQMFMAKIPLSKFTREEVDGKTRYVVEKEWEELDGLSYKLKYVAGWKETPDEPVDLNAKVYISHVECMYSTVHNYWTCAITLWRSNALYQAPAHTGVIVANVVENLAGHVSMLPEQMLWFCDWIVAEHGIRLFDIPLVSTVLCTPGRTRLDIEYLVRNWLHEYDPEDADAILDRVVSRANNLGCAKGLHIPFAEDCEVVITTGRPEWYSVKKYREEIEKYTYMRDKALLVLNSVSVTGIDVQRRSHPVQWELMMEQAILKELRSIADEYLKSKKK